MLLPARGFSFSPARLPMSCSPGWPSARLSASDSSVRRQPPYRPAVPPPHPLPARKASQLAFLPGLARPLLCGEPQGPSSGAPRSSASSFESVPPQHVPYTSGPSDLPVACGRQTAGLQHFTSKAPRLAGWIRGAPRPVGLPCHGARRRPSGAAPADGRAGSFASLQGGAHRGVARGAGARRDPCGPPGGRGDPCGPPGGRGGPWSRSGTGASYQQQPSH